MNEQQRIKNIIHPNFRQRAQYDWESNRAAWILSGIHDSVTTFSKYPHVGQHLMPAGPIVEPDNLLTAVDIDAYLALYPQNAKKVNNRLEPLTESERSQALLEIAQWLSAASEDNPSVIQKFTTRTTKASQTGEARLTWTEGPETSLPQPVSLEVIRARLLAVKQEITRNRMLRVRLSFGNPPIAPPTNEESLIPANNNFETPVPTEIHSNNIYDWRVNVSPGRPPEATYYSPIEEEYIFAKRTRFTGPDDYNIATEENNAKITPSHFLKKKQHQWVSGR